MTAATKSPVSCEVSVARLPKKGMPVSLDATPVQLVTLARDHHLLEAKAFHADLVVSPWKRDGIAVSGRVEGDIVQECIVTLEPVEAHVDEKISAVFIPEGSRLDRFENLSGGEMILDPEGPDSPESFSGTSIDVGALAEEFFALGIDPYPRKEGIEPFTAADVQEGSRTSGILAEKLATLKRRD